MVTDMTTASLERLEQLLGTVGESMTVDVISLDQDMPVTEALRRLEKANVTGAPVLSKGEVVGIATIADLMKPLRIEDHELQTTGPFHRYENRLAEATRTSRLVVGDVMTSHPTCVRAGDTLIHAVRVMTNDGLSRMPVVTDDKLLVGMITRADIMWAVARAAL